MIGTGAVADREDEGLVGNLVIVKVDVWKAFDNILHSSITKMPRSSQVAKRIDWSVLILGHRGKSDDAAHCSRVPRWTARNRPGVDTTTR